jgi:hypothetical protein
MVEFGAPDIESSDPALFQQERVAAATPVDDLSCDNVVGSKIESVGPCATMHFVGAVPAD